MTVNLQPSVEFSPKKQNKLADTQLTISSDTLESDNAPLTSPLSTPKRASSAEETALGDETDAFDYGVFDLKEDELKPAMPKKINKTRTTLTKCRAYGKEASNDTSARYPSHSLNSFFVESSTKPSWSPSKSNSASPKKENITISQKSPGYELKYNSQPEPGDLGKRTPKRRLKVQEMEGSGDVWDLLSDIPDQQPKKKTMILKEKDTEANRRDEQTISEENDLSSFFHREEAESQAPDGELSTPVPPSQECFKESTASPRISKNSKTYGLQRSFLLERQDNDEDQEKELFEENDITLTSEQDHENTESLKTITNLRAQGENAQFLDELNFILEGIESVSTSSSLLELALKLFDNEFLDSLKHYGLPPIQKLIDTNNSLQVFVLGFIICKITEGGDGKLSFDDNLVNVVINLLSSKGDVEIIKESRATKSIFKEFKERLDRDYTPAFLGLTLLIQNGLFINDGIFETCCELLKDLKSKKPHDHVTMINMILLLFESFLSSSPVVPSQFKSVVPELVKLNVKDDNCHIAILKVLIVLSVKKLDTVFSERLVDKSIESCLRKPNTSVGLLELGLLINLVEKDNCCKQALVPTNLKKLLNLQNKLEGESRDYFALLIGILLTKNPIELQKAFEKDGLKEIASLLKNFNSKGNKLLSLQVEEIMSKVHELKIL